ncbi:MAG: AMP-binding protein, partial [Candidatus Eisenbacteria bacterium]
MVTDFLLDVFRAHAGEEAVVFRGRSSTFGELLADIAGARAAQAAAGIAAGAVVALEADFTPAGIAHMLALLGAGAIVAPLAPASLARHDEFRRIAQAEFRLAVAPVDDAAAITRTGTARAEHPLYDTLRASGRPGLLLFTSGSSGEPRAALH